MIEELEADPAIGEFEWRGVPDYFADAPGALRKGRTIFPANIDRAELGDLEPLVRRPLWTERWGVEAPETMVGGQALIGRALLAFMNTGNGEIRTNTALERLIVEDGRVVGVEAVSDGEPVRLFAERGVLLAAGGFESNRELREQYQPPMTDEWTMGVASNTGDALLAGIDLGADTALLDEAWFAPGVVAPDGGPVFYTMVWSGIWVNAAGERFMNERLPYDRAGHEILRVQAETGVSTLPTSLGVRPAADRPERVRHAARRSAGAGLVRRRAVDRGRRARSRRHAGGARRADRCARPAPCRSRSSSSTSSPCRASTSSSTAARRRGTASRRCSSAPTRTVRTVASA